jgi:hypothetical protein
VNETSAYFRGPWIASRSLSSGAHSRDPLARNDGERTTKNLSPSLRGALATKQSSSFFDERILAAARAKGLRALRKPLKPINLRAALM